MAKPMLLVETPRAGKSNHRFLVSEESEITSFVAAAFVSAARSFATPFEAQSTQLAIGGNFLAVLRPVLQSTSHRVGEEILVLLGVDTAKLGSTEHQALSEKLVQRLNEIESLLQSERITASNDHMIIPHPTLTEWLRKDFASLPTSSEQQRPLPPQRKSSLWFWGVVILGWLIVAGLVVAIFWPKEESPSAPSGPKGLMTQDRKEEQRWQKGITRLAELTQQPKEELPGELFRLATDKPAHLHDMPPDQISLVQLSDIPSVQALLEDLAEGKSLDPFAFLSEEDRDWMREQFPTRLQEPEDAVALRKELAKLIESVLIPFQQAVLPYVRDTSQGSYYRMAREITAPKYQEWQKAGSKSKFPMLHAEDVRRARLLYAFLTSEALKPLTGEKSEVNLELLLRALCREETSAHIALAEAEQIRETDRASEAALSGLRRVYKAVRDWLGALSRFHS